MSQLDWRFDADNQWRLTVKVQGRVPRQEGEYDIFIQKRPAYCDRGDWIVYVDGHNNDIDGADGFPRYFFGSADEVKRQMETWLGRRRAYQMRPPARS